MTKGFVKLPRAFYDSPLWNIERPLTEAEAYIEMYRRAAFRADKLRVGTQKLEVNPGQFIAKTETLARDWNWSVDMVIHYLNELDQKGCLRHRFRDGVHLVTISDFGDNEHFIRYFGERLEVRDREVAGSRPTQTN